MLAEALKVEVDEQVAVALPFSSTTASGRGALVSMMQPADLRQLNHPAEFGPVRRPGFRRIAHQREVAASPVVVLEVPGQDPEEMNLAKDDDVIQAFPSKRADEPLRICVLPPFRSGGGARGSPARARASFETMTWQPRR